MPTNRDPQDAARQLAEVLRTGSIRAVLAESCTAGLAAATLASVPGISEFFCGSAVTYRNATKSAWLGVDESEIHKHTAVSAAVSKSMAVGVLRRTPEAQFAASITGDLGPNAPAATDGVVFIAIARRVEDIEMIQRADRVELSQASRLDRQAEAAALLLRQLREAIIASV